jgi:hypothetical protein
MVPQFGKSIHHPTYVLEKTWRLGTARYTVPVRRAFEVNYSESMRDPGLSKSAEAARSPH